MSDAVEVDLEGLLPLNSKPMIAKWLLRTPRCVEQMVKRGDFPAPTYGGRCALWRKSQLIEWLGGATLSDDGASS